tara:strand:+ start:1866 stop:2114 length:249 start_codon:yes stop_codon:yes gene_type:complete
MTKEQYEDIMRELELQSEIMAELKEMAWSKETQEQLLETMTEMSEVMAKQNLVYEQQAQIFERMEKYLNDEDDEPEKKVLLS